MAKNEVIRGSASELAKLLMISVRRVNQLVSEARLTRQTEGDFILPEAISEYYSFKFQDDGEIDYIEEKAKHEKAKRELTEMELRKRRHELHEAEDIRLVLSEMLVNFRGKLLCIPNKMSIQLANLKAEDIEELLRKEIEACLLEVKDYSPNMFDNQEEQ